MSTNKDDQNPLHGYVPIPQGDEGQTEGQRAIEDAAHSGIAIAASPIPWLGAIVNEMKAVRWQRIAERRLRVLEDKFDLRMRGVPKEAVDWAYVDSEAFFDLVREAVEAVLRTRHEAKIDMVARVLRGAVLREARAAYSPEEYMRLVADLTNTELNVALSLFRRRPTRDKMEDEGGPWTDWQHEVTNEVGIDRADLLLTLSRLRATGLLLNTSARIAENGALMVDATRPGEVGFYEISPSFDKLMSFVTHPQQPEA